MPSGGKRIFSVKDYLVLGLSMALAFGVWLVHNLSQPYSGLVQCTIIARCDIDGHVNVSSTSSSLAARCGMTGFNILAYKNNDEPLTIDFSPDDVHQIEGERFYVAASDFSKYIHDIFPDKTELEYFVTDTMFFLFPAENFKKVPVNAVSSLSYRSQYLPVGHLKIVPDSVLVYGTEDVLSGIDRVNTEVITLHDLSSDSYGEIDLEPINGVRMSNRSVEYSISVTRYVEHNLVLPVVAKNVPPGVNFQILPSEAEVCLKTFFPSTTDFSYLSIVVDYEDYLSSIGGKCVGAMENLPQTVLGYSMTPDVFDCLEISY